MLNLTTGNRHFDGKIEPIRRWDVWFMTPFGPLSTLSDALEIVGELDMPGFVIAPVAVAITDTSYEIWHPR